MIVNRIPSDLHAKVRKSLLFQKSARDKTILSSSIATDNNASSEPKDDVMITDEEDNPDEEDDSDKEEDSDKDEDTDEEDENPGGIL